MTEYAGFRGGVRPGYVDGSNQYSPFQPGTIDVVGCGDVSSDTVQRARVEATTLGVGALRLEVVAPDA